MRYLQTTNINSPNDGIGKNTFKSFILIMDLSQLFFFKIDKVRMIMMDLPKMLMLTFTRDNNCDLSISGAFAANKST